MSLHDFIEIRVQDFPLFDQKYFQFEKFSKKNPKNLVENFD